MLGLIVGAGVAALGTVLLHGTIRQAFAQGKPTKPTYMAWLAVIQPILLLTPLLLFALWKPGELLLVGIGATAWYVGYLARAIVKKMRRRDSDREEG